MRASVASVSPHGGLDSRSIFAGLDAAQLARAQEILGARTVSFGRGDEILVCAPGDAPYGVLETGAAFDVRRHADGERSLVDVIEPGDLCGEGWKAGQWVGGEPPRDRAIIGAIGGTVLLLDQASLNDSSIDFSGKSAVQANLLRSVLHKEERLRAKIEILRHRSLRGRIGSYLLVEAGRRGSERFTVPLSRAELAEYLHADRAAVSRELSRMRDDGLIEFYRGSFALRGLDEAALEGI